MRRLPATLNPCVSAGIRADEHAASPSRMRAASSGGRPHASGMRRSGAASRWARRVRLPLRGQHRLARLRRSQAPCFPFNYACRTGAREHQNACECRRRGRERQGGTGCAAVFRAAGDVRRKPPPAAARRVRAHVSLCYRMRRVRCSHAHSACAVKRETGRRRSARPVLSPQRYAARATHLPVRAPRSPTMPLPSAGREGRGPASGQPGYRPTQGASPTLAERPIRGGRMVCAFRPFARASFDPA